MYRWKNRFQKSKQGDSELYEKVAFNLKAANRFLRRDPSLSLAVILILAMGVGVNSALFSAIDAIILHPLPFPESDQLVALYQHDTKGRNPNPFVAPVRLEDWNRLNSTFQGITGYYTDDLSETSGPLPEKVTEALVAPRFLQVMGVSPLLGRSFTHDEERFGGPDAALISYQFWRRRFQGAYNALGQKLRIGKFSYLIVGIMPASFTFPSRDVDLWVPSPPDAPYALSRDNTWFNVVGRLKFGVTLKEAQADIDTVQHRLGKQFPKPDADLTVQSSLLKETVGGSARASLWLLYGSASLLLLIACSNIAALLLARTAAREQEICIRFSLGASRYEIVVQLLTEVFGLALIGSLLGLVIAAGTSHAFHLLSRILPRAEEIRLNWRIVLYSLACSLMTTILCGTLPAIRGTKQQLAQTLSQAGRSQVSARNPVQWILVGVQVTLAVTLLTSAGLLVRTLQELSRVSLGFDPSHVLTFQVTGSWSETSNMNGVAQRIDRTLDNLRMLPGVQTAATASMLPGVPGLYQTQFTVDGQLDPNQKILADSRYVSAGYFDSLRIPLLVGRECNEGSAMNDMLVNRDFANTYLGNSLSIGHHLTGMGQNVTQGQIVGIVGDAREEGVNKAPMPIVYSCFSAPNPFPNYLVRTFGDPSAMAETIRRRIHEIEPARSVYGIMPLQQHLDNASFENRLRAALLILFAGSALLLASIGLYGTVNYAGRLRRREIGVRLAVGALPSQIVRTFLFQSLRVAVFGCIAGLFLSVGTDRLIANMLYGVSSFDPPTYGGVLLLVLMVTAISSLIPAYLSTRVEPIQVLREN